MTEDRINEIYDNITYSGCRKLSKKNFLIAVLEIVNHQKKCAPILGDDFFEKEVPEAIQQLAKKSTAPDKETPDWIEADIKQGMIWMFKRLMGINDED